jgi:hypothetical protein
LGKIQKTGGIEQRQNLVQGDKTTREIGVATNKFNPAVDIQPIYVPVDKSDKYVIVFWTDDWRLTSLICGTANHIADTTV